MPSDATSLLFAEHRHSLVKYATRLVGSRAQAEDLVQEAWVRLNAAARESSVHEPLGYLYRIIRNLAFDHSRAQGREGLWQRDGGSIETILGMRENASPETIALYREQLRELQAAMDEMPSRMRIAFGLHRVDGLKMREIAELLDISIPMVQKLIAAALLHCQRRLGR